jgi:AcrR family transcriptional regulator
MNKKEAAGGEIIVRTLDQEQTSALEELVGGKSVTESAKTAGVSRATLYRWLKTDAVFRAAYNQWHEQLEQSARSRLLVLSGVATETVREAMLKGDAKVAMQLLEKLGLIRPSGTILTETDEVQQRATLDTKKKRMDMEAEDRKLDRDVKWDRVEEKILDGMMGGSKKGGNRE